MSNKSRLLKFYGLLKNPVSLGGLLAMAISTLIGLPMMFIDFFVGQTNPYVGILTYLVFPVISVFGVAVAVVGAVLVWRKKRQGFIMEPAQWPKIDFNDPFHRKVALITLSTIVVLIVLLAITSYRAYHFSDSVEFCGTACHQVMKPEYTAYQHSSHARVACVSCHIGPGAGWFVKSKVSGAYQVYSVMFNKYSRPIETPIKNLRPAQDTCEQCHWPSKFFGAQQKTFTHYLKDETNTPWQIQTLLNIGGGDPKTGATAGIHWHMNIANEIYYKDETGRRDVIPWVKSVSKDGTETEYRSSESMLSESELAALPLRRMDCLDCHNRPSHGFPHPSDALDQALASQLMDVSLPFIKREATRVLMMEYKTEAEGLATIESELKQFYLSEYASLSEKKRDSIDKTIEVVKGVFSRSIFPEMKADWRAYPNHLGHVASDGCFRCHDGNHKSEDGKVITNDCNACHTILAQGTPQQVEKTRLEAQPFRHPVDVGIDVTQMKCTACHASQ